MICVNSKISFVNIDVILPVTWRHIRSYEKYLIRKITNGCEVNKLVLENNQIIDFLGGRIEAVRQHVRTKCLNAKLDKEAKKLNFDDTYCYNFEGVLVQYDCNKLVKS